MKNRKRCPKCGYLLSKHKPIKNSLSFQAKLTAQEVKHIRFLYQKKGWKQIPLAQHFKISQSAVSHLLRGQTYRGIKSHAKTRKQKQTPIYP